MAGAGYKLFNTGDVLTAAQVNTYLMEQSVMVFADAAARTTALTGVVAEGMLSYLKDTNAVEVYNGSAWVASDDPNAIQNTIVDAKGDLIAASAADTPARLAVGADYGFLMALGSASLGMTWQGGAWTDFAMTVGVQTGSLTTSTATAKYLRVGKMCVIRFVAEVTNIGTGSGYLTISLPFTVINNPAFAVGAGREETLTGKMVQVQSVGNSTTARLYYYDNSNILANNCKVQGLLVYEVA